MRRLLRGVHHIGMAGSVQCRIRGGITMEERITVEMTEACLETLILSLKVNEK